MSSRPTGMSTSRQREQMLAQQMEELKSDRLPGIQTRFHDDANKFFWRATIRGSAGTPYVGGTFFVDLVSRSPK